MRKTHQLAIHRQIGFIQLAILMTCFGLYSIPFGLMAQDDFKALQTDLSDLEVGSDWIYGELQEGISRAKETGKPMFVLFR